MTEDESLYLRDGDAFVGTGCTQNGWHAETQAGGAVLALLGHLLEDVPTLVPMTLTRLTVDLVRPVPIGQRLWVDQTVIREGKTIQAVDAVVRSAETEYVRSRALRVRDAEIAPELLPVSDANDEALISSLPEPGDLPEAAGQPGLAGFLATGAELRRSAADADRPPCAWVRLRVPVVAGEPVRRTSQITLPMDCVNLIGVNGLPEDVTAINPDVSAHVMRAPAGEWVAMVGETRFAGAIGHGFSMAAMADLDGVFGVTSTSQVVQHRP